MKLLLDTHAFIWWDSDPGRLSRAARMAIGDPANSIWFSVVSVWEIVIKSRLGKLELDRPLEEIIASQRENGLLALPVNLPHVLAVDSLPPIHGDPFDRLLMAQAIQEDAEFVSADRLPLQYPVRVLW